MLGDPRFLSTLTSIDKDNIPEKVVTRPILNDFPNYVGTIGIWEHIVLSKLGFAFGVVTVVHVTSNVLCNNI